MFSDHSLSLIPLRAAIVAMSFVFILSPVSRVFAADDNFEILAEQARADRAHGNFAGAEDAWRRAYQAALSIFGAESAEVATALNGLGVAALDLGHADEAIDFLEQALSIRRALFTGNQPEIAITLSNLGMVLDQLGDFGGALNLYNEAIASHGESAQDSALLPAYTNRGICLARMGRLDEADISLKMALTIAGSTGQETGLAAAFILNNLGNVSADQSRFDTALRYYKRALALKHQILGDTPSEMAADRNNLGRLMLDVGEYNSAVTLFGDALAIIQSTRGDSHPDAGISHSNLGSVYAAKGDYRQALMHLQKAHDIAISAYGIDPLGVASTLKDFGRVYHLMGDGDQALYFYNAALRIYSAYFGEDHPSVLALMQNVAVIHLIQGDTEIALGEIRKAVEIGSSIWSDSDPRHAELLNSLGMALVATKNLEDAEKVFLEALAIRQMVSGPRNPSLAIAWNNVGFLNMRNGSYTKAAHAYGKALGALSLQSDSRALRALPITVQILWNLAEALEATALANSSDSILDSAVEAAERSIAVMRSMRQGVSLGSRPYHENNFEDLPAYLLKLYRSVERRGTHVSIERIFEASEMQSAWAFLDMLAHSRIDLSAAVPDNAKELASEIEHLIHVERERPEDENTNQIRERIEEIAWQLERVAPEYSALRFPAPGSLSQVRSVLRGGEIALEYVRSPDRWFVVAISHDSYLFAEIATDTAILSTIKRFRKAVESGEEDPRGPLRKLYTLLVEPTGSFAATGRVVVVPAGELEKIPFAALVTPDGTWMGDRTNISYVPSLAVLAILRRRSEMEGVPIRGKILAVGDPDYLSHDTKGGPDGWSRLPGTRDEVMGVSSLFGETDRVVMVGSDASEEKIDALDWTDFGIMHFALHGYWDASEYVEPALVLATPRAGVASDGYLTLSEIAARPNRARIAVLSACNSGLAATDRPGSGVSSLARAFLLGGSDAVVVSLWNVSDVATTQYMIRAYAQMKKKNRSLGKAMEYSRQKLLQSGTWSDVRYWAPFILVGGSD